MSRREFLRGAGVVGKGFAADLVSAELLQVGAMGANANLDRHLRVRRSPRIGRRSSEGEPRTTPERASLCVALADGAVATTSSRRRAWRQAGRRQHHVIDPGPAGGSMRPDLDHRRRR